MVYLFIQKNRKGGRILFSDLLPKCLQLIRLGQAEVRTWELYLCLRMGNRDSVKDEVLSCRLSTSEKKN